MSDKCPKCGEPLRWTGVIYLCDKCGETFDTGAEIRLSHLLAAATARAEKAEAELLKMTANAERERLRYESMLNAASIAEERLEQVQREHAATVEAAYREGVSTAMPKANSLMIDVVWRKSDAIHNLNAPATGEEKSKDAPPRLNGIELPFVKDLGKDGA